MRQLKLLPGTMLLMLASTLSINPVNAQTNPATGTGETPNQLNTNQTPSRTNTQPVPTPEQTESQSAPSSTTPAQTESQSAPSSTDTTATNTVTGTIKSIEGQAVTLETADGKTQQMTVSRADLQRLNLREGMQISATVDSQSVASDITLAQSSTSTTGTEATSSQSGTTSTTTESTTSTEAEDSSATPTTTTENTSTTESTPANRPVRALW